MNLILTGFMGTGKTTVGRLVAEQLGRPFVDMDALIEQRAGQSIPAIFAAQGEATFRRMERELCHELAALDGLVIATGGGALIDPVNRALMTGSGVVICLEASPEVLLARLQAQQDRPLLDGPTLSERIAALLEARRAAYAALPYHLDTSALTPRQTMEEILALWQKLTVST